LTWLVRPAREHVSSRCATRHESEQARSAYFGAAEDEPDFGCEPPIEVSAVRASSVDDSLVRSVLGFRHWTIETG
jgi:hypothetical protein